MFKKTRIISFIFTCLWVNLSAQYYVWMIADPNPVCAGGTSSVYVLINGGPPDNLTRLHEQITRTITYTKSGGKEAAIVTTSENRSYIEKQTVFTSPVTYMLNDVTDTQNNSYVIVNRTVTVNIKAPPSITANNNGPVKIDSLLFLTGGPDGMVSYNWTGPNSFISSTQNPVISKSASKSMEGNYTLLVDAGKNCISKAVTNVKITPSFVANASNNGPVCEGSPLSLKGGPPGMKSYSWGGPNGFSSTEQSPTIGIYATTAMAGEYLLTVSNGIDVSKASRTGVIVYSPPVAKIFDTGPIYLGSSLILKGKPYGMKFYSWIGPNGFASTEQNAIVSDSATMDLAGIYFLTVSNGYCPPDTDAVLINIDKGIRRMINHDKLVSDSIINSLYTSVLASAFTDPLVQKENQMLPAVTSVDELSLILQNSLNSTDELYTFFRSISITGHEIINNNILKVTYDFKGKKRAAYAYVNLKNDNTMGFLIVPGSGQNQGYEIFNGEKGNYQKNILDLLNPFGNTYILIKLNHDVYAIHDGEYKLNFNSYINYFINEGGSYSARYIEDGLALMKFIKQQNRFSGISGLSQGGLAALIIALLSVPEYAIISSGYSVLMDKFDISAHNQIMIPGISNILNTNTLKKSIIKSNTKWLFTWGKQEPDIYGIEAYDSLMYKKFGQLPNIRYGMHNFGHMYPDSIITDFLLQNHCIRLN